MNSMFQRVNSAVSSAVLTAVIMKSDVFRVVRLCTSAKVDPCSEEPISYISTVEE
jgi:hypothetical protein